MDGKLGVGGKRRI